jgi:hypothetical protein
MPQSDWQVPRGAHSSRDKIAEARIERLKRKLRGSGRGTATRQFSIKIDLFPQEEWVYGGVEQRCPQESSANIEESIGGNKRDAEDNNIPIRRKADALHCLPGVQRE